MNVNRISMAVCGAFTLATALALPSSQLSPPQRSNRPPIGNGRGGSTYLPGPNQDWKPSKLSALVFATKTDQAMSWLKVYGLSTDVFYKDPYIGGKSTCTSEFESMNRF